MKRLVWLLLAVFCTALAQVQPAPSPAMIGDACSCCEIPGSCGAPDCGLPPSSGQTGLLAEKSSPPVVSAARRRAARLGHAATRLAFLAGTKPVATATDARSPSPLLPPALALFKVHCSFLI